MPSICLIGNCHVANLKLGWPAIEAEFPDFQLTFFASDGLSLSLEILEGKLVAPNVKIRERLALTSGIDGDIAPIYDAYVICGLALSSIRMIRSAQQLAKQANGARRRATLDGMALDMEPPVRSSIAIDVISKLRQLTDRPVFLIATPLTAYERHAEMWEGMKARNRIDLIAQAYGRACTNVARELDAVFVPQSIETVGPIPLSTWPQFYRLPPEQVKNEKAHHTHMNAAFGSIVLCDVLQRIGTHLKAG